jgi:alpha,alpha-trehalase
MDGSVHTENINRARESLMASGLLDYPGGIPTSLRLESPTPQQWDFPNAWAPEQMFIIEGLLHSAKLSPNDCGEAFAAAQKWVTTTYNGWKQTGNMFEKYDCRVAGAPGGGRFRWMERHQILTDPFF